MVRTPDLQRRRQLLDALIEEFAAGGIGDRSLREVAGAVGTSHRMLLHHFGSREDLLVTVIDEVERRQMARLPDLPTNPAESFAAMWADLRRPELRNLERLFFECYARAAQGEKPFAQMVPGAVDGWLVRPRDGKAGAGGRPWPTAGSGSHQRRHRRGRCRESLRRFAQAFGNSEMSVSTSSSALVCHLSKSRWPLKSKPVMPCALVKRSAP